MLLKNVKAVMNVSASVGIAVSTSDSDSVQTQRNLNFKIPSQFKDCNNLSIKWLSL